MSDDSQRSLRQKLQSFLTAEFDSLSPDVVASVLNNLATELHQMSEAGLTQLSEVDDRDWVIDEAALFIEAEKDEDVGDLLKQVLNIGAIVVQTSTPPALNEFVMVEVRFPTHKFSIATQGRIVAHPPGSAAIEITQIEKDDRVALERMQKDLLVRDSAEIERMEEMHPDARIPKSTESFTMPGVPTIRTTKFRRAFDPTNPDVKVLDAVKKPATSTQEFFGPEQEWLEASGDPERIERLADDRVIDILLQISQDGLTGMIEVSSGDVARQFLFEGGMAVESIRRPRFADEELGLMLHRAGRITNQQLLMAAAHADETGKDVARSLLDLDVLDAEKIRNAIAGRLTHLIGETLASTSGEVKLYPSTLLAAGFLPTPPIRVHVAIERVIFDSLFETNKSRGIKDREKELDPMLEAYPEIVPTDLDRVQRALSSEEHRNFAERLLNGRKRLKEVITESVLAHADTFAIIASLHRMGIVRFDRSLHQTIVRERYRENVTVKYLSVHKASYFEVLNVHWSSYTEVIQRAYDDLIVQFDPETVPEHLEAEVGQRVSEIRERVESAYQVLCDRETRHAYRTRIMPEYKLAHAIPLFMKQCELAERRQQWADAKDAIKRVLEIDPKHRDATVKLMRLDAILENRLSPNAADSNF